MHPEAIVANYYRVFKVANTALNASVAADAYFITFDRDSNAVLLPAYVQKAGVPDTQLFDAQQMQLSANMSNRKEHHARRGACAAPESVAQVEGAVAAKCARSEEEPGGTDHCISKPPAPAV